MTAPSFLTYHTFSCNMRLICLHRFQLRKAANKIKDIIYERFLLDEDVFYDQEGKYKVNGELSLKRMR